MNNQNIPSEYKPLSMWAYFGYQILFALPVIGLIAWLVTVCTTKNKNLKNFALSYLCTIIVVGIAIAITVALGAGALLTGLLSGLTS